MVVVGATGADLCHADAVSSDEGLVTLVSAHSVTETIDRLAAAVTARGLTVFVRVDHGANAVEVGMPLRATQLLVFGNPRAGTPLMQDRQLVGLDLPLRALAWEDGDGTVRLTYPDAHGLARRYGLGPASAAAVDAIASGLVVVAAEATGTPAG